MPTVAIVFLFELIAVWAEAEQKSSITTKETLHLIVRLPIGRGAIWLKP